MANKRNNKTAETDEQQTDTQNKKSDKKTPNTYNESFADLVRKHAGIEDKFRDNIITDED